MLFLDVCMVFNRKCSLYANVGSNEDHYVCVCHFSFSENINEIFLTYIHENRLVQTIQFSKKSKAYFGLTLDIPFQCFFLTGCYIVSLDRVFYCTLTTLILYVVGIP